MKLNLLFTFIIVAMLNFSCKKEDKIEIVTHDVYQITEIDKSGCFGLAENELPGISIGSGGISIELNGDICTIECGSEYYCYASDSVNLIGNTLELYLINEAPDSSCKCNFNWSIKLKVIENKGVKLKVYGKEKDQFELILEIHKLSF